jgi:hypothetical protein
MARNNLVTDMDLPAHTAQDDFKISQLSAYHLSKSTARPHRQRPPAQKRSTAPFEMIFLDIKVVTEPSISGKRCCLVIVDDFSRW